MRRSSRRPISPDRARSSGVILRFFFILFLEQDDDVANSGPDVEQHFQDKSPVLW